MSQHLNAVSEKPQQVRSAEVPQGALVCVVDDDEAIRRSLSRLFRSVGLQAEAFPSATAFLQRAPSEGPSCLVLDLRMPGVDGLELQGTLAAREEQIVFLTGEGDISTCARAMKAGAVDFLVKPVDDENLLGAVLRALVRSARVRQHLNERATMRARINELTPREFEVMQHVIAGKLNKQIADELNFAEKTVKVHRGRVMQKMRVTSVADLVRAAQVAGVAPLAHAR